MDYALLASELLDVRSKMLHVPASQQLSRMARGELFVLNYLLTHDTIVHPKELSEQMTVTTARIASLLGHMEEKNFIRRCPDPEDNRQIIVCLTPSGRKAIEATRAEVIRYVVDMLQALGPEDAESFVRIQEKIWSKCAR